MGWLKKGGVAITFWYTQEANQNESIPMSLSDSVVDVANRHVQRPEFIVAHCH